MMRWMLAACLLGGSACAAAPVPGAVAVVELFTSEGCSSCPPADEHLADLRSAAQVYVLAFHVDYWDRLGWRDPFARHEFTTRQAGYGELYTPEMVVNGTAAFVGSDRDAARRALAKALSKPAPATVKVEVKRDGGKARVSSSASAPGTLHVALVEDGLVVDVKRGENAGRTLRHEGVVRALATGPTVELPLAGVAAGRARVVVWLQDPASRAILGAAASAL
jgi:hypothetical protein